MQTNTSIVITYRKNKERFLPECLASIREQTIRAAEVVVIEDCLEGETCGDEEILIQACKANLNTDNQKERCTLFQFHRREGKAAQINKGIKLATCDYLGICSADDYYEPTFIEESLKALASNGNEVSWSNYNVVDDNRVLTSSYDAVERTGCDFHSQEEFIEKTRQWGATHGMFSCMATWFAKRQLLLDTLFDEELKLNEDLEWLLRASLIRKYRFAHIPKVLANYRVSASQASNTLSNKQLQLHNRYTWSKMNMLLGEEVFAVPKGPIET